MQMIQKARILCLLCCGIMLPNMSQAEENVYEDQSVIIECYQKEEIRPLISLMNDWCVDHFKKFPYLWIPQIPLTDASYNSIYVQEDEAFVLLAKEQDRVIGLLAATPIDSASLNSNYFPDSIVARVEEKGFDPHSILYVGFFLLSQEHEQEQSLTVKMYRQMTALAKKMGKPQICYMEVVRPNDHPLKPLPYVPPEPWGICTNDFKTMGLTIEISWPTLQPNGSVAQEINTLAFYINDL